MEFVKKPIPVHAIRWTGKNLADVRNWIKERLAAMPDVQIVQGAHVFLKRRATGMTETLWQNIADEDWSSDITAAVYDQLHETWVGVKDGQWIMCGTKGEFYPCEDDGTGTAPLNYGPAYTFAPEERLHLEVKRPEDLDDPLRDMLEHERTSSLGLAEKALPSDITVPEVQPGQQSPFFGASLVAEEPNPAYGVHPIEKVETPQERGARHADRLINDVFVKVPQYEHADFNPATSHLHICAKTARSDNPCDKHCIHALYSLYDDLMRDTPEWIRPFVRYVNKEEDILDFNKFPVPQRLQDMLGMVFVDTSPDEESS
jgi:hypothetical protein